MVLKLVPRLHFQNFTGVLYHSLEWSEIKRDTFSLDFCPNDETQNNEVVTLAYVSWNLIILKRAHKLGGC